LALLAVLQPDQLARARLTTALRGQHELVLLPDLPSMWHALERLPADGCILDIYNPKHPVSLTELERFRRSHASVALIVYADFNGREMDLFSIGRLRVDGVVLAGTDESARKTRETVAQALASSMASRIVASLERQLHKLGAECLRWAIENAHHAPSARDLAESFSLTRRTLAKRLRGQNLPSPGRLLLWGRLIRATHMLRDGKATVERVAYAVGYSSGAALARALRRETGHYPREVMRRGGPIWVAEAFVRREASTAGPRKHLRWSAPSRLAQGRGRGIRRP